MQRHHIWRGYNSNLLTSYHAIKSIINLNPSKKERTNEKNSIHLYVLVGTFYVVFLLTMRACMCVKCILENSCNKISWAINDSVLFNINTILRSLLEPNMSVYMCENINWFYSFPPFFILLLFAVVVIVLFAVPNVLDFKENVFNFDLTWTDTYADTCRSTPHQNVIQTYHFYI